MEFKHISVLLNETVDALNIDPNGIYVDGTAGGAGHSTEIAKKLKGGRLIAIDRDPDAVKIATERLSDYNATVVQDRFSNIKSVLEKLDIRGVDGVMMDLGVSSHQLDKAERGFSYRNDAPLDMRMSQSGRTAADLVAELSQNELVKIFRDYGEEQFAVSIARAIVNTREKEPITTTSQLADIISRSVPSAARRDGHPARKCFQALRIAVNGELQEVEKGIADAFEMLNPGGVLAVITFHSLEDRIVKQYFASLCKGCTCPPELPVCVCGGKPRGRLVSRKPILPSKEEIEINSRSRSAKLRAIEKL
ncbi:MAG: 16S rRNA (cytosine(1402)-N(4))-methyltransferase RsmH [Clostridia bacterium]|nr:16S rRNA (cytosine(1402)-N(4))-methyltransferase RsmH [Clostridia bacterium]